MVSALKTTLDWFVFFRLYLVKKSWQCKKPLHSNSKTIEVTGLQSDVSQLHNSDEKVNEKGLNVYKI